MFFLFFSGWSELITKLTHETKIKPSRSRVRNSLFYKPARYNTFSFRPPTSWNSSLYFSGSVVEPVLTCHLFQRFLEMYGPRIWLNVGSSGSGVTSIGGGGGARGKKSVRLSLAIYELFLQDRESAIAPLASLLPRTRYWLLKWHYFKHSNIFLLAVQFKMAHKRYGSTVQKNIPTVTVIA